MSKFLKWIFVCLAVVMLPWGLMADDFQLPDPGFEDWSGTAFDGKAQPKYWHGSNVEQTALGMSFKFNFTHKESGRSGSCLMVQDQVVGAAGITETGPGYASLGYAWQHLDGLNTGSATAGTYGGISFTHRPDTVSIWIRRTGDNTDKEDFHILFYSWSGTAKGSSYKSKSGSCTTWTVEDEESDIRIALDANECKTVTAGTQIAEGWLRDRKYYGEWTNVRVPVYYLGDGAPTKCNLILSASNYPNFRANSGLYEGNSLYVDDVELIYSSKIQTLRVGGTQWKGFDPNSTEEQVYYLPEGTTAIPDIEARRGAGTLSNVPGQSTYKSVEFKGRKLSGNEIEIVKGKVGEVTTITVYAENNRSKKTVYKIRFQAAASSNAKLANILYYYKDNEGKQQHASVPNFSQSTYNYNVELPYGAQGIDSVTCEKQELAQKVSITQPTLPGTAELVVTAADGKTKATYKVKFSVGQLADNTLKDILVNGKSIPGFTPTQTVYKVSLPVGTTTMPTVKGVSAYADGEQTIVYKAPTTIDGGTYTISVTTPGNTVPKVYKLNFKLEASSYSYLSNLELQGDQIMKCNPAKPDDETQINFSPENMTYYATLKMGTTTLPKVLYSPGDEFQTIKVTDLGGAVDGTYRIAVTAGNGSDQSIYKIVFSTEKSDRSTLNGILIGGVALEGFEPDVLSYTYALPVGESTIPTIEPILGDEYQTYDIAYGSVNGKTRITVTAGDGSTTVYQITFSVATYSVNTLKMIYLDGKPLEGFEPEKNEYWVNLEQGTTKLPVVTYDRDSEDYQTVSPRPLPTGAVSGDYKLTVRPQSGASRTYIIHFSVATSDNTKLQMIYLDGKPLAGFDPEVLHYTDSLPEGESTIPTVTFDKGETSQRVLSVLNGKQQTITVTAESGAKREYVIDFIVRASDNAKLEMIYLDGVELPGFEKETLEYHVQLTGEQCPVITVTKAPGQQVTITAPYAAGVATISVKPEQGSANVYKIYFEAEAPLTAQLTGLFIDGTPIADFKADSLHYTATYSQELPTITYTKKEASQQVSVLWKTDVAWIYVVDAEENKAAYSITFTRTYSGNSRLEAIFANGVKLPDFAADKLNYAYELEAGSSYPAIRYQVAEDAQVVFFGQVAEGKWAIHVAPEKGDATVYTVAYTIKPYNDPQLVGLQVDGFPFAFDAGTTEYGPFVIQEGVDLPQVSATSKEGQSVMVFNANDSTQQVMVMAENGAEKTYTIKYSRVKSSTVQLENIFIDSKPLAGFDPDTTHYTIVLPRGTKVVPNVNPIAAVANQTVTTYVGRPNGTTTIEVQSQDGHKGYYTIDFQVDKSDNTKLKSLMIGTDDKDVDVTEYTFDVPFGTTQPYDISYVLEEGQTVHYIEAPITGTTKIIVTNEKGNNSRTYSIRYNIAELEGENKVTNVAYSYVDASNKTVEGQLVPTPGENIIELPYGAKSFTVTDVEKSYPEQTIYFYNGGIRRGAQIIAVSNRKGEEDVRYTIVPQMPEYKTEGRLKSLRYKSGGVWHDVPNFRPDVFNYMIDVESAPTADDIEAVAYDDKEIVKSTPNAKTKQITLTVKGGDQYSVCWYYFEDKDPFDLSDPWILADKETGLKPSNGWKVIADYSAGYTYTLAGYKIPYVTGKETTPYGDNGVMLSTMRQGALMTTVPGMMTLGEMYDVNFTNLGNSVTKVRENATVGKQFRNTPEQLKIEYNALRSNGIDKWRIWITMSDGTNYQKMDSSYNYSDNPKSGTKYINLVYPTNAVQKINATLNSCTHENAADMSGFGDNNSADLVLQNMHLVYNSELTGATVNGKGATKNGNVFTYNLAANDVMLSKPTLKFTKKTRDQAQVIEWLNDGEWVNGKLTARVINYGENSIDSTHYYVVISRDPVTSLNYTVNYGSYASTQKNDTVFVALPSGTTVLPDFTVTPESVHQLVTMTKKGNAVTVNIKAEDGAEKTTVYVFREEISSDVEPVYIDLTACTTVGDPEDFTFTIAAEKLPEIDFAKKAGQTIDVQYTENSFVLKITAQDGVSSRTYTINRIDPTTTTSGLIKEFLLGGTPWNQLGGTTYEAEGDKPTELITFERKDDKDSVVYLQTSDKMEWQVYGSDNHTYRLTYPVIKSTNATLADLRVDGKSYSEFSASDLEYTLELDSMTILEPVAAEMTQTITTSQVKENNESVVYTTTVTAEDGVAKNKYSISVRRRKSADAQLAGILLDSVALEDYAPGTFDYTVELPLPADGVKRGEPQMPSITYLAGHPGQTIEMIAGTLNTNATELIVKSEDGTRTQTYTLTINSEKSHCADLTAITVNGAPIEQFEKGRHFYSISLQTSDFEVDYTTDDHYQKVTTQIDTLIENRKYNYTLHVTAEDGTTTAVYEVMIFVENQSNDAQLANILLNNMSFEAFERELNPGLVFDPANKDYTINLPSGTTLLPEVSAQLKMDGQKVEIIQKTESDSILLDVTAVDGTTHIVYVLRFLKPLSKNADLSMIFLNGDSLPNFTPNYYFYHVNLEVGVHELPEVVAQKGEATQTIDEVEWNGLQATIKVHAEDPTVRPNSYVLVFSFTPSEADTLAMIFEDGQPMKDFAPQTFYYSRSLPVGTVAFPDISWEEADEWQKIEMDTVESSTDNTTMIRQIHVTAENGKKNTYTVSYTIEKSSIATLQMIFVDQKQLPGFQANTMEYYYELSAAEAQALNGSLPKIEFIQGDEYQSVMVAQAPKDSLGRKSLEYKSLITVTAASGNMNMYTIHYPVELSTDTTLNMINVGGKPLTNFDSERFNYKLELEMESAIPVVSVIKKETAQVFDIQVLGDTVQVFVTAENTDYTATYTLAFERLKSKVTLLRDIILLDANGERFPSSEFPFRQDVYSYAVKLDYVSGVAPVDQLPTIQYEVYDNEQTVDTTIHQLPNGDVQVDILVTAPNGEDQAIYSIIFKFIKPSNALLAGLAIHGESFADFSPLKTEYVYKHPYGTDPKDYFTADDVTFELIDSLATVDTFMDEYNMINIVVTAQDEVTKTTYLISQTTLLDGDNALAWITVDGDSLKGFDPEETFYTYYVYETATPNVQAAARSVNALDVDIAPFAPGDTCVITCIAADNSMRKYYIHFAITSINPGAEAQGTSVMVKRVPGTNQLFIASIRSGVDFALYDRNGKQIYYRTSIPTAEPNNVEVYIDGQNHEVLGNVSNYTDGITVDVIPGEPLFYVFFVEGKKLSEGRILFMQ